MRTAGLIASIVLTTTACGGGSATAPTGTPPLPAGSYVFALAAPDGRVVNGQLIDACPGAGPASLTIVQANVTVDVAGAESRVRPASDADGSFEMRLTSVAVTSPHPPAASGWIRGTVQNTRFPPGGPPTDARATFAGGGADGSTTLEGEGSAALYGGPVTGSVTVSNGAGVAVSCAAGTATWSLSKVLR